MKHPYLKVKRHVRIHFYPPRIVSGQKQVSIDLKGYSLPSAVLFSLAENFMRVFQQTYLNCCGIENQIRKENMINS